MNADSTLEALTDRKESSRECQVPIVMRSVFVRETKKMDTEGVE